jgi:DNA repair protein RadC
LLERPRERLLAKGPEGLTDGQLLAILLRTGRKRETAVEVAMELLKRYGGIEGLSHLATAELCRVKGIGPAKAAQIKAALELGRRSLSQPLSIGSPIRSSREVYLQYYPLLRHLRKELFKVLLLDTKNRLVRDMTVSEGALAINVVHPREVFNPAVRDSAAGVLLLHNHPSGDPTPSAEDRALTDRIVAAGRLLGIRVLDHLVIGDGRYVSFADQGWLRRDGGEP